MISKQKIYLIVIAILFVISLGINIARLAPEGKNYENYSEALRKYNNNDYSTSYYLFGKVSRFSKLKPAAIYRQALCSEKLGDTKTELRKYKEVYRFYPASPLAIRAKYLKAQQMYEEKNYRSAKKDFKSILNKYPGTDYSTAAKYYLGSIELENSKKYKLEKKKAKARLKAAKYFKDYLIYSTKGKFAVYAAEKWVSLNCALKNEDNLLLARTYQDNLDYDKAAKYLKFTNMSLAWPYFVKNTYATKNYFKVKYYTELGLKGAGVTEIPINEKIDEETQKENIYKAIDLYLKISDSPKLSLSYLLSIAKPVDGYDYLLYKNCTNLPVDHQTACFNTLYYKYPDGQFAAESLANIFYANITRGNYFTAQKLGRIHMKKFAKSNSAPKVMFWLAKASERMKNYEAARGYYKSIIRQFPDDYYAYHAFLNLNRFRYFDVIGLKQKPIEFPYRNSSYGFITELVKVNDYGLINQLYKGDDFIKSWLFHKQGEYSNSARIARDAMDKLSVKPPRNDLRWRLVYPIHYYDEVRQYSRGAQNDSTLILSIIREESYFNPLAKSPVGARGLMQLMPSTAMEAANISGISLPNMNLLFDVDMNIRLGNVYFSKLKKALFGKDILAVIAYNGGIGSVSRWKETLNYYDQDDFIEQIPYPETQNYLKKVYRSYWNYLRIYDGIKW